MNLPKEFIDYTRHLMGEDLYAAFEKGMSEESNDATESSEENETPEVEVTDVE